jgi:hypothetical protein
LPTPTDVEQPLPEMHLQSVDQLSDEQLDSLLEGIRTRRLAAYKHYEAAQQAKQEAHDDRLRDSLARELRMFEKEHEVILGKLDKLEKRVLKVRAIRLELEG